ncbi:MAG TPA: MerR family transcriptional regulator [Bacillota bacterium]|nr:MerR family transcriptional regulator [Bacillota bacterium]
MMTVGQLGKAFHLSRSTLLYYDSIGLLKPTERTEANYRRYTESDVERLREICRYRETGMPLEDIKEILDKREQAADQILEKRLDELNHEIRKLNIQRQIIVYMLKKENRRTINLKNTLIRVLENTGLTDVELGKLHAEYEREAPGEHQAFLEFMGVPSEEIAEIRAYARKMIMG